MPSLVRVSRLYRHFQQTLSEHLARITRPVVSLKTPR